MPDDSSVVIQAPRGNVEIKPPVNGPEEARGTSAPTSGPREAGNPPVERPQGPPSDNADPEKMTQPIARAAQEVIRPFNGKDFRGWNGSRGEGEVVDPSSIFRIEGEELVWTGNSSGRICLDEPLGDFSLKFEYLLPLNGRYHLASCLLMLAEGEPYQIGQANYRVCWAGCVLTNSEVGRTGDILSWEHTSHVLGGYVAQRKSDAARPAGEWNEVEIRCEGRSIRFFLNGREVNRVEGNRAITCNPGLHSWGTDIRYRNIRLARLTKNTKATEKNEAPAPF